MTVSLFPKTGRGAAHFVSGATRRSFLQAAILAIGVPAAAQDAQVPKVKFGDREIGRLVAGCNPFYGFGHFNATLAAVMRDYYTPERVCAVMHQCNRYGIDTAAYHHQGRAPQDLARFRAEGGKMNLIVQCPDDPAPVHRAVAPLAMYHHGEWTDRAFQRGDMASVREWTKRARDLGTLVGVGTHKPEVIALVEEQGWDVDFYAGCVYNRTGTPEEWRKALNGELPEMPGEIYIQSDPPRMYRAMRQTKKTCFAFKILAAGRIGGAGVEQAFRTAFESIKPGDGVFIGLFPTMKDEVKENAERVRRLLS
jgi:hypothetical protein